MDSSSSYRKPQHPRHSYPPQRNDRVVVDRTSLGAIMEGGYDHGRVVSPVGHTASTVSSSNAGSQPSAAPFSGGGKPKQVSSGSAGSTRQNPSYSPQLSSFIPGAGESAEFMFRTENFSVSDIDATNSHSDCLQLSNNVDQTQASTVQPVTQRWDEPQLDNDDLGKDLSSAGFLEFGPPPPLEVTGGDGSNKHWQVHPPLQVKGGNDPGVPPPLEVKGGNGPDVHLRVPQKRPEDYSPWLPPGFRFHPTDEELVVYYLTNKVVNREVLMQSIAEVDLNKCEPWDLPAKAKMGEQEWYFFSLRDRKYPTGMRTNRATEAGYWKATGKDREVMSSRTGRLVGMKKTLVFYRGRAPKGEKSNWIMHEYRIEGEPTPPIHSSNLTKDEWVVCRIFQKSVGGNKIPMECNSNIHHRSTNFNTESLTRSSLPVLLEYPNPNNLVDDSDCLVDAGLHGVMQEDMRPNNSWGGMKTEIGIALEDLHHGKGSLLQCPSYLIDLYDVAAADLGVVASFGLKVENGGYPGKQLSQDSNNFNLQNSHQLMSLKYLENRSSSRGINYNHQNHLRACKAEPYAGDGDDIDSSASQRSSSLIDSWVGDHSSAGFSAYASLPLTNESGVQTWTITTPSSATGGA